MDFIENIRSTEDFSRIRNIDSCTICTVTLLVHKNIGRYSAKAFFASGQKLNLLLEIKIFKNHIVKINENLTNEERFLIYTFKNRIEYQNKR